jgi:hypothetical protein
MTALGKGAPSDRTRARGNVRALYDDFIDESNPARVIDAFVDALDLGRDELRRG